MTSRPPLPSPRRLRAPALLGLYGAAVAIAIAFAAGAGTAAAAPAPPALAPAAPADTSFPQPRVISSVNGVLDVRLVAMRTQLFVPNKKDSLSGMQMLRVYQPTLPNGRPITDPGFPGPTFRVKPGDMVRIRLVNQLPATGTNDACSRYPAADSGIDRMPNCFHGESWSNIHYHGFHVTPNSPGDNVLMKVMPGDSFQFNFQIPSNQSPGTHWYHPHKHGSVATQVTNGMSGAFFVVDSTTGLDSLTRAFGMREFLMAIQQVDSQLNLVDNQRVINNLVNGKVSPILELQPGEVARLRIVNENVSSTASFKVLFPNAANQPLLYDVARDGVQLAPENYNPNAPDKSLFMSPGNRLDVFIKAPGQAGDYELHTDLIGIPRGSRRLQDADTTDLDEPLVTFRVRAAAPGYNSRLPQALPPLPDFLQNLPETTADTAWVLFVDSIPATKTVYNPGRFYLGNQQTPFMRLSDVVFIPTDSAGNELPMVLGQTQTWKVLNYSTTINHPFHIHINPFQVDSIYAPNTGDGFKAYFDSLNVASNQRNAPVWLDVVPLPRASVVGTQVVPGYVIVKQRYDPFEDCPNCGLPTGPFVMHCHILGHEERGMMQKIEIYPSPPPPGAAGGGGQHRHR